MGKVKIWQAPFRSLYSLSFYREVLQSTLSTGIAYLALLSLLAAAATGITFNLRSLPEIRKMVDWLKVTAPPLFFTPEGLQMKAESPYVMNHPEYGPVIIIDLNKKAVEERDFSKGALVILTARHGFLKAPRGVRTFDYDPKEKKFEPVPISAEMYEKFGKTLQWILLGVVPIAVFFFFFIWKFTAAVAYSGFALILNRFRQEPLPYEKMLVLCLFAMTPFVLIELLSLIIPNFTVRGGFFTGLAVTLLYLAIALFKTENVPAQTE